MNKFFKWIKEHVRPYCKVVELPDEITDCSNHGTSNETPVIEDLRDKTEIGLKITFKF